MKSRRWHGSVFTWRGAWVTTLTVLCAVQVFGVFRAVRRHTAATQHQSALERRAQAAMRLKPSPTESGLAKLNLRIEGIETDLAPLRRHFTRPAGSTTVPGSRAEAYFALRAYMSRLQAAALKMNVGHRPEERWGFAAHQHEGPPDGLGANVHAQCVDLERTLSALIEAKPARIERVQRERPTGLAPDLRRSAGDEADFFSLAPGLALPVRSGVDVRAYRVTFVGDRDVLRTWLNRLAGLPGPVIVRDVIAEPVAAVREREEPAFGKPALTRFTVTYVEVVKNGESAPEPERARPEERR